MPGRLVGSQVQQLRRFRRGGLRTHLTIIVGIIEIASSSADLTHTARLRRGFGFDGRLQKMGLLCAGDNIWSIGADAGLEGHRFPLITIILCG